MRLVFAGTPAAAVPTLRALAESHDIAAVVTRPDALLGRKRVLTPSPVARAADALGLPVIKAARLDEEATDRIARLRPELGVIVAYGGLVREPLLSAPAHGWINLHFSLLPAWRGAAPVQAALAAGDEITGASTFRLEAGLDTGPVYGVVTETIRRTDTAGDLLERLADAGATLLESTLDGIADGILSAAPQPADGVSLAPKITVDAARVIWAHPAHVVDRHIRAVTPAPGAWTMISDLRVKLGPITVTDETLEPGEILARKDGLFIGTATTAVRLGTVQPPGKKAMAAADWARGARLDEKVRAQ